MAWKFADDSVEDSFYQRGIAMCSKMRSSYGDDVADKWLGEYVDQYNHLFEWISSNPTTPPNHPTQPNFKVKPKSGGHDQGAVVTYRDKGTHVEIISITSSIE